MFTYLGTDAAGNQGIYMARLSFFSASPPAPPTSARSLSRAYSGEGSAALYG